MPTSSPQATRLRFSLSFTMSEPHRDNPSLVFRIPYNLRVARYLNHFPLNKKKKFLSLREGCYNWRSLKIPYSICRYLGKESFWEDKTFQFRKTLSGISCPNSPIYRPLMAIQKLFEQLWLFRVILKNSLLVIDYTVSFWRVMTLQTWNLNFFVSGNQLHKWCNRLQAFKI